MSSLLGTLSRGLGFAAFAFAAIASPAPAQTPTPGPDHHAGVQSRGDHVMGFDHDQTTHHFLLTPTGGVIQVTANAETDTASRDAIRRHLSHIAVMFSEGDFDAPMLIHGRVPPGVPVMKEKAKSIRWTYAEIASGGRVLIATDDPKARAAIHEFLRFQIEDHHTGDPLEIGEAVEGKSTPVPATPR